MKRLFCILLIVLLFSACGWDNEPSVVYNGEEYAAKLGHTLSSYTFKTYEEAKEYADRWAKNYNEVEEIENGNWEEVNN